MNFHIAIIGAGLTGTALLIQLNEALKNQVGYGRLPDLRVKVSIFERKSECGPGFPHSRKNAMPFHITNMCAEEMGVHPKNPNDFQEWVTKNRKLIENKFPGLLCYGYKRGKCSHYPRTIMGEYLKETFENAIAAARTIGIEITPFSQTEVMDIEEKANSLWLTAKDLPTGKKRMITADCAILATGHWRRKDTCESHMLSPWPARKLAKIVPNGATVAIVGSSLSAIEVILTLTAEGRFAPLSSGGFEFKSTLPNRHFVMYSRRGLLPKVRGKTGAYKNKFLTQTRFCELRKEKDEKPGLFDIFNLLNADLEIAYGKKIDWPNILNPSDQYAKNLQQYLKDAIEGDGAKGEVIWQTVFYQFFSYIRDAYLSLSRQARYDFEKQYTSLFFTHAATQPIVNAEKLLALIKAGLVTVQKLGTDYRLVRDRNDGRWIFHYKDQFGEDVVKRYQYVVDARGQTKRVDKDPSPLTQNLIQRQLIIMQPLGRFNTGSVWIEPDTQQTMKKSGSKPPTPNKRLYAVGAMTRGQVINASMAHGIVQSTARVAASIVNEMTTRLKKKP